MSRRGNCWDNALQESFFGHFKDEANTNACDSSITKDRFSNVATMNICFCINR